MMPNKVACTASLGDILHRLPLIAGCDYSSSQAVDSVLNTEKVLACSLMSFNFYILEESRRLSAQDKTVAAS